MNWPTGDLNGIYAITAFLILNIFLGIIGDILVPDADTPERSRPAAGTRGNPAGSKTDDFRGDIADIIYRQCGGCKYLP